MYGNKLKEIRKQLSLTQGEMANLLDITYRTYASYERNENNPPYSILFNLCTKYKINLNWFIANEGEMFYDKVNSGNISETHLTMSIERILKNKGLI